MTNLDKNLILGALDSLAVALINYDHTWTEGELAIYDQSRELLGEAPVQEDESWGDDNE
jgi:hypothetical protein